MRRRPGFTLMDILLALVVVGTVLLALASVIPVALGSMNRGQSGVTASNLARHYLDWWKQQDFATLQTLEQQTPPLISYVDPLPAGTPAPTPPSPQQYGSLDPAVPGPTFLTQVLFNPVQDPFAHAVDPNVIQIDVYVEWQAGGFAGQVTQLGLGTSEVHYSTCVYNVTSPW